MGQLLSQCNVKYIAGEDVQAHAEWFINVNTKEEYVQAQKTFQMNERFLYTEIGEQLLYKRYVSKLILREFLKSLYS